MNSGFLRNVLVLVSGNAVAMALPILFYPVLTRLFTPEDFALFGIYVSIFTFLEVASAGRYDFAIIMPANEMQAINLVGGGLIVSIIYASVILILIALFGGVLSESLNHPELSKWLYLLPITLILVSISKLGTAWLIRIKKFKAVSINRAGQKSAELAAQLSLSYSKFANGLILGEFTGRLFNALFSLYQTLKSSFDPKQISKSLMKLNLKQYSDLPKYSILPSMLNTLGGMLPVFIISKYYSVEISGSYNFSRIILSVPAALISSGISQVLMQQVSEKKINNLPILNDIRSLVLKLIILSIVGVFVLSLAGGELFEWTFGAKWRQSGEFTSILIFSYAITFIISPLSMVLVILEKIKWAGYWQFLYFFAVCSLWLFSKLVIFDFLIALVIVDLLAYLIYGFLIYKAVLIYERRLSN